ncbi:MAG: hypothetical protein SVR81_04945 [Chloroflexota bacterium]|nr:hypothetical protein [Chloroflexota bacterium]
MARKQKPSKTSNLLLLVLSASLALSLTMRVFGFYTLPHIMKGIVTGYLALVLAMIFFRFIHPRILARSGRKSHKVLSIGMAVLVTVFFFILIPYHITPIRTTHSLKIVNTSDSAEISVWEIVLPGAEALDLPGTFGADQMSGNRLLISPGESLEYTREMAGGVTVRLGAMAWPAQANINWDDLAYDLAWEDDGDAIAIQLPGWTWGSPSLPYRLLGFMNIVADLVSVLGVAWLAVFLLLPFPEQEGEERWVLWEQTPLRAFTISIVVNLVILFGTGIYAGLFEAELHILLLLLGVGILLILRDLVRRYRKWLLRVVLTVLVMGIAVNGYLYLNPPHELHQTLTFRPYDSYEYLADRIGARNATYLSIGYYQYLRGSTLVIAEPLYEELDLEEGRLHQLNRLQDFRFENYEYQLTDSEVNALLQLGEWSTWPNRLGGGEYYLLPEVSEPGATYHFFSYGQLYFLVPSGLIEDTGVIDVPLSD